MENQKFLRLEMLCDIIGAIEGRSCQNEKAFFLMIGLMHGSFSLCHMGFATKFTSEKCGEKEISISGHQDTALLILMRWNNLCMDSVVAIRPSSSRQYHHPTLQLTRNSSYQSKPVKKLHVCFNRAEEAIPLHIMFSTDAKEEQNILMLLIYNKNGCS